MYLVNNALLFIVLLPTGGILKPTKRVWTLVRTPLMFKRKFPNLIKNIVYYYYYFLPSLPSWGFFFIIYYHYYYFFF